MSGAAVVPPPEESALIRATREAWESIDFVNVQDAIHDQASTVIEATQKRLGEKSALATSTQMYREAALGIDDLLLLYQRFADSACKSARFNGDAFLTLYRILRELPDPSEALRRAEEVLAREEGARGAENRLRDRVLKLETTLKSRQLMQAERESFREESAPEARDELAFSHALEEAQAASLALQASLERDLTAATAQLNETNAQLERVTTELWQLKQVPATTGFDALAARETEHEARLLDATTRAQTLETQLESERRKLQSLETRLEDSERALNAAYEETTRLKRELRDRPEASEVRELTRQLRLLRSKHDVVSGALPNQEDPETALDSLEAWLLDCNQRLTSELAALKAQQQQQQQQSSELRIPDAEEPPETAALELRNRRLLAKIEKQDLEVEELRRQLEDRAVRLSRNQQDMEALQSRIRFLSSYKQSEMSTLITGDSMSNASSGVVAGLGRGMGHEFRRVFDAGSDSSPWRWPKGVRRAVVAYVVALHLGLALALAGLALKCYV